MKFVGCKHRTCIIQATKAVKLNPTKSLGIAVLFRTTELYCLGSLGDLGLTLFGLAIQAYRMKGLHTVSRCHLMDGIVALLRS